MTVPPMWQHGSSYLCLGVGWRTGAPCLDVVEVSATSLIHIPLVDQHLGFQIVSPHRYCTGRYAFSELTDTVHLPCPNHEVADKGGQCSQCASRDDFRFAHHFHVGGHAPDALVRYMAQPHWVYIASFADGSSKVGTAADLRQKSRLDEQGAVAATYVARTDNGRIARNVEDAITRNCGVVQNKRRAAKMEALAAPLPLEQIAGKHSELLDSVVSLVDGFVRTSPGLTSLRAPWTPPAEMKAIVNAPPVGGWPLYEHNLLVGEHGLRIEACCGQTALVRTEETDDAMRYLADLGKLKGVHVVAGEFSSPDSNVQSALF